MFGTPASFVIAILLIILMAARGIQRTSITRKTGQSIPHPVQPVPPASTQPTKPTGNFCIHCGAPNLPDARVCTSCGLKLPEKLA